MAPTKSRMPTQAEVIVECWEKLDVDSVGRRELEAIGEMLCERFGAAAPSPATIARVLADQVVPLSHPDVLDTDTIWREKQLHPIVPQNLETIDAAFFAIGEIQSLASTVQADGVDQLRLQIRRLQEELELIAKSQILSAQRRAVAAELASWLTVWLQNPTLFDDWLALRRDSSDFLRKFS